MKAIIPVAGIGSRLRPHTHTQPKSLIPVAGKPILAHIIDNLIEWGVEDFIFIIGYMGEKIEHYIGKNYPNIRSHFVVQANGKGTAHALWLSRDLFLDDSPLLIVLGDTIFKASKSAILGKNHGVLGVKKVDDPRQFGVAEINEEGVVTRLVEKPNIPKSNLALVGVYCIHNSALFRTSLNTILENNIKTKGEYHLTDALMDMIDKGEKFETTVVESWFDCGKKDILLETNAILLKLGGYPTYNEQQVVNSIIVPPVFIGNDVMIENSIIGPNVSIGDESRINYSIIKNSIIGNESDIDDVHLNQSVIGNDSSLKGSSLSLNLGDSTEIKMG
ncbi:MAG: glucose-1-phosphate thymidylyltransferase [Bacteroidia bacterium]|jgi:glucose-1-phosphate thymidylyltransferase